MTTSDVQRCPLCDQPVRAVPRYPRYVCRACAAKARSADGRPLFFFNRDWSGGVLGRYLDSGEVYDDVICYIDGVKCMAEEARFGGVVIQPAAD